MVKLGCSSGRIEGSQVGCVNGQGLSRCVLDYWRLVSRKEGMGHGQRHQRRNGSRYMCGCNLVYFLACCL